MDKIEERDLTNSIRMMAKVAHLYHAQGMVQSEIAKVLGLSQARISRMLTAASEANIVRTMVVTPAGLFADLEAELEVKYGLQEVHIVDANSAIDNDLPTLLGRALAGVFSFAQIDGKIIGCTPQNPSVSTMIHSLGRFLRTSAKSVVELVGGTGTPQMQHAASSSAAKLAELTDSEVVMAHFPYLVGDISTRAGLISGDTFIQETLETYAEIDIAIFGIGGCSREELPPKRHSELLRDRYNEAVTKKAVAEICGQFVDADGSGIQLTSDELVLGISREQLRNVPRKIGISGGSSNHSAVLAALKGGWVDTLVTDIFTAKYLLKETNFA